MKRFHVPLKFNFECTFCTSCNKNYVKYTYWPCIIFVSDLSSFGALYVGNCHVHLSSNVHM